MECFTACELLVLESAQLDKMRRDFVGVTESFFKLQMQQYKQLLAIQIWCVSHHVHYSDLKKGESYRRETAERLSKFTY